MPKLSTGLFFLKGAPLHNGHIFCITQAYTQVDRLHVVLCWDEKFQKTLSPLHQRIQTKINRTLWLKNSFKQFKDIIISVVDETEIPGYPHGEDQFTALLMKEVYSKDETVYFNKVFSSEVEYNGYFTRKFPEAEIVLIDPSRSNVDISATRIREDVYGNWDYLSNAAKQDYVQKVCIIGVESSAKSTLTMHLANYFSTNYIEEIGRTICENELGCSESLMTIEDYEYIAMKHKVLEREALKHSNKVLFSDTNNLITLFSAMCMNKDSPLLREMIKKEHYDLIIFLDCDVEWVYDSLRLNGSTDDRLRTYKLLEDLCTELNVNYTKVSGTYNERYLKSIQLVENLLKPQS